jgi:hypothetical protein
MRVPCGTAEAQHENSLPDRSLPDMSSANSLQSSQRAKPSKKQADPLIRTALIWNNLYAGSFLLIGNLPRQAFGDLFEVPPEVNVQRFIGLDRGHFRSPQVFGNCGEECDIKALCRYFQRFPRLLSSSLSPERIDESVPGESPLVNEHTGPGAVRHTPCVDGAVS